MLLLYDQYLRCVGGYSKNKSGNNVGSTDMDDKVKYCWLHIDAIHGPNSIFGMVGADIVYTYHVLSDTIVQVFKLSSSFYTVEIVQLLKSFNINSYWLLYWDDTNHHPREFVLCRLINLYCIFFKKNMPWFLQYVRVLWQNRCDCSKDKFQCK